MTQLARTGSNSLALPRIRGSAVRAPRVPLIAWPIAAIVAMVPILIYLLVALFT